MDIEPQDSPKPVLRTNVGPHRSLSSAVRRTPCVHIGSPFSSHARLSVSRDGGSRCRSRGMRPASSSNARRRRLRRGASEASTTASPPPRPPIESTRRSRQAARAARPRPAPRAPYSTRSAALCTLCAHCRCLLHADSPPLPRLLTLTLALTLALTLTLTLTLTVTLTLTLNSDLAAEARRPRRLAPAAGSGARAAEHGRPGAGAVRDEAGARFLPLSARAARRAHTAGP